MRDKSKKLLSVAAAAVLGSTFFFAGCGASAYQGDNLGNSYVSDAPVSSNGGFAVQKGDFVYFINGYESYTADNTYGDVVKGALMRISVSDLNDKKYDQAKTVVPSLFVAQDYTSGIYIYGDYVYYATPTTDKNLETGAIDNTKIDFKRAKLDGTEAPMSDYYFRLENNASKYRFVEEDGTVYCLYEEDGDLKSFNTKTKTTTVLVKDATSYFYDKQDLTNPVVYYTMSVQTVDQPNAGSAEKYNQLYCVNAAAKVTAINAEKASYTVSNGKTYDFNEKFFNDKLQEAKDAGQDAPYDLSDYTTYPYVNLGTLVLDGVGDNDERTMFSDVADKDTKALHSSGYSYTITGYENGGVYFTRKANNENASDSGASKLYYVADTTVSGAEWNTVSGNAETALKVAAADSTKTTAAVSYIDGEKFYSLYTTTEGEATVLKRDCYDNATKVTESVTLTGNMASTELWKIDAATKRLYYYGTGTNGKNLCYINYDGSQADYDVEQDFGGDELSAEYAPVTLPLVDWDSSWYKPEIFGDTVLYVNVQSMGANSYKYIYATKLSEAKANQESVDAVEEFKEGYNDDTKAAINYYYRTGKTTAYDAVKKLYDTTQQGIVADFIKQVEEGKLKLEGTVISMVGKMTAADKQAIEEEWVATLKSEPVTDEEEGGLETWAIVLIIVGSVLVVAAGVTIPLVIVYRKKKAKKAEEDATVNAYKRKIDTTDDKSIDVYADETETVEENAEEGAEQAQETTETESVEETPTETKTEE